jgi:very-short-patch-repair endonuclease
MPAKETGDAARTRSERRAYLTGRGYRVCEVKADEVEKDVSMVLHQLSDVVRERTTGSGQGPAR